MSDETTIEAPAQVDPDGRPIITLSCPECEEELTGRDKGRGSVQFKLGIHRASKHGYRSTTSGPARKRAKKKESGADNVSPLRAVIDGASSEFSRTAKKAPSADELSRALGRALGITSAAVASYAAETDEGLSEVERDALVDYLRIPERTAQGIMSPIGRAISSSSLNQRAGRAIVSNVDVVTSVCELSMIALRWRRYFAARSAREASRGMIEARVIPQPSPGPAPAAPHRPEPGPSASPGPMRGVVVSAEMVQAAMANGGAP